MQLTRKNESFNRLDAIIEGASRLSVEKQELILAVVEGMVFTRRHMEKEEIQTPVNRPEKLVRMRG